MDWEQEIAVAAIVVVRQLHLLAMSQWFLQGIDIKCIFSLTLCISRNIFSHEFVMYFTDTLIFPLFSFASWNICFISA